VTEAANQRLRMQMNSHAPAAPAGAAAAGEEGVKISIIVSEVESVGGFVGSSFSEPMLSGGILLSILGYMIFTQPWMALIALLIFCPQLLFIPFLQDAINLRTKRRIQTMRALSVDIVDDTPDEARERTKTTFRRRIKDVYRLNMQIYMRKFGMNFLMNLLYTLGVIGILAVGGWLLLQGRTEVGTIVAFISGLSRMNGPWGDLVNYFRDHQCRPQLQRDRRSSTSARPNPLDPVAPISGEHRLCAVTRTDSEGALSTYVRWWVFCPVLAPRTASSSR
jgi:ABC-type multidrug transport system fused ATPase/permease subunit